MSVDFSSVRNYYEHVVFHQVTEKAAQRAPDASNELLLDVACVALNRLPPRYIRHDADFYFFLTEQERADNDEAIAEAVDYAFGFVQSRLAARQGG